MCVGVSGNLEQPFNTLNFRLYFWSGRRLAFLGQSEILRGIGSGLPTGLSLVTNGQLKGRCSWGDLYAPLAEYWPSTTVRMCREESIDMFVSRIDVHSLAPPFLDGTTALTGADQSTSEGQLVR